MVFEKQQGCENNTGYSWSVPRLHHSLLLATEQSVHTPGRAWSVQSRRARQLHHLSCLGASTAACSNLGQALVSPCSCWTLPCGPCFSLLSQAQICWGCEDVYSIEPIKGFPAFQDVVGMRQSQDGCLRLTEQPQHCLHHLSSLPLDFPRGTQWDGDTKVPPPKSLLKLHLQSLCPRSCLLAQGLLQNKL